MEVGITESVAKKGKEKMKQTVIKMKGILRRQQ